MGLFGPRTWEVWAQFCREEGYEIIRGGFFAADRVIASFYQWRITMDTYTVTDTNSTTNSSSSTTYTRIRADIANPTGCNFEIYRKGLFSELGKALGMQDLETGYGSFDQDFIIKGNDPIMIQQFFSNNLIRELIARQRQINFKLRGSAGWLEEKFPPGRHQLYFEVPEEVRNLSRLGDLFRLFAESLLQLEGLNLRREESYGYRN